MLPLLSVGKTAWPPRSRADILTAAQPGGYFLKEPGPDAGYTRDDHERRGGSEDQHPRQWR
jgi:hypothetical protein